MMLPKLPQKFLYTLTFFLAGFVFFVGNASAQAVYFNLEDFIAQTNFPEHTLSTGEVVSYSPDGGSNSRGSPVRQWKNSNYEQFFVSSGGIYRREDTSWAPNGGDAFCDTSGNQAVYTLDGTAWCTEYSDGQEVDQDSGAWWAPATGSWYDATTGEGSLWSQQPHQIVTIDRGALSALMYCQVSSQNQPPGFVEAHTSPNACRQSPTMSITGLFGTNEYTFCGGNTNNSGRVVTFSGMRGAGAGDGFVYMEGCGLVGFRDAGLNVGIVDGCGVTPPDPAQVDANCTDGGSVPGQGADAGVRIIFEGRIRSLFTQEDDRGNLIAGMPIENALVALYQGSPETDAGNLYGRVTKISNSSDSTDAGGNFSARGLRIRGGQFGSFENSNYLIVWCNSADPVDAWKIDLSETTVKKDFYVPCDAGRISSARSAPDSFDLSYLGQQMQCGLIGEKEQYQNVVGSAEIAPGYYHPIQLDFGTTDNWPRGTVGDAIDPTGWNLPYTLETPEDGEPGRNELAGVGWAPDVVVNLAGDYNVGQKHPTRIGDELEDQLQLCEEIKRCNQVIANEDASIRDNRTNHTCYNLASRLSDPFMWERLYPTAYGRNEAVCLRGNGSVVHLNDIEPPFDQEISSGPYSLDKEYFPYLFLLGDPQTGTNSRNWQQSTWDSFNTGRVDLPASYARDDPFQQQIEANQKVISYTETQASNDPSYSRDIKDTLVNAEQAGNVIGEEKGMAGIISDYDVPFSNKNPDVLAVGNDNIERVGRGDYQIGRTYEMCTKNVHDGGTEDYFNEDLCRYFNHPWCSGYKYLSQEPDIITSVATRALCAIPFIGGLLAFFGVECIDVDEYELYARGTDIFWAEFNLPTRDAWEAGAVPLETDWEGRTVMVGSACGTWQEGDSFGDCNCEELDLANCTDDNLAPLVCKRELEETVTCRTGCGSGGHCNFDPSCVPGYVPILPGDPPVCCESTEYDWTFFRAHYTCPGNVYALFKGENLDFQYAPFNRDDSKGVTQIAEALGTPYDVHRECGPLTLTNYEITSQESPDRDTRAFNSGKQGIGCTENTLGRFMMSVADYFPEAEGPSIDPFGTYVITDPGRGQNPGSCNEFNCFGAGVDTFEESVACAAATLRNGISTNSSTWFPVDKYGPYCDNETRGLPFGFNLFTFFDRYASGDQARTCSELPPGAGDILAGTSGMDCPAQSSPVRQPGDPAFNYYRGALVDCPIQDLGWSGGTVQTMYEQICGGGVDYSGIPLATDYNCDGGTNSRIYYVLEAASTRDVNPWLLLGIWATESWWGEYPACRA